MQIESLFKRQINRAINGVIKADQADEASIWQELEEYVVTRELDEHFRKFFDSYLQAIDNPKAASGRSAVWISGFFGSGKSHFLKILSYLLENKAVSHEGETRRANEFFESKISDPMLAADIERALSKPADVLLFNIDSKADMNDGRSALLNVFISVPEQGGGGLIPEGPGKPGQLHIVATGASGHLGIYRIETQCSAGGGKLNMSGIGSNTGSKEALKVAFDYFKANAGRVSAGKKVSDHDFHLHLVELNNTGPAKALTLPGLVAYASAVLSRAPRARWLYKET